MKQKKKITTGLYKTYIKRLLDICLSLLGLILLSPVIAVTASLVKIKLGSPVIYIQKRPGKDGKIFCMYKFRSMSQKKDNEGNLLPDEARLTKFGKRLRSTSLDELPELYNILKGDMSIVGPRPLLVEYLPLYNEKQKHRHDVRPGLTGLAQVNGRNAISWDEKFKLDIMYIESVSFSMDMKIVLKTVKKVFCREDINSDKASTMELFRGSK